MKKKKIIIFILLILICMTMILIGILLYRRNNTKKEILKQRDNLRNTSFIINETHKIRYKEVPELYINYLKKNKDFKDSEEKLKNAISKEISELQIKIHSEELILSDILKEEENKNDICETLEKNINEEQNSSQEYLKELGLQLHLTQDECEKIKVKKAKILEELDQLSEILHLLKNLDLNQLSKKYDKKKINCNFNKYPLLSKRMQILNNQYDDFKSKEKIKEEIEEIIKDKLKKRQLLISIQILRQYEDEINKFLSKKHHQEDFINYQLANNEIKFYLDMAIENLIDVKETLIEKTPNNKLAIEKIIYFVEEIASVNLFKHTNALEKSDGNENITSYIEDKMVLNISRDKGDNYWDFRQDKLLIKKLDVNDEENLLYTPSLKIQRDFIDSFEQRCPTKILSFADFKKKFLSTEKQFNEFSKDFIIITDRYPNTLFRFLSIGCNKLPYEDVNQFLNQVFVSGWQSR